MKNNTEKLEETKLTITLRTGFSHRNKREEARIQNDHTSYYLSAINYFIRVALEAESLLELQTDSQAFRNDARFRENLQLLIQISEGLAEWLPDYSSAMRECADVKEVDGENEQVSDAPEHHPDLDALAGQISEVLKNPNLPVELYNAILYGTDDIINESSSDVSGRFETSPEHIKAVLKMRSSE